MLNINDVTTNKHPFIKDVEEIFGCDYPSVDSYVTGATLNTIINDGFDEFFLKNLFKKVQNVDLGLDPENKTLNEFILRSKEQLDENDELDMLFSILDSKSQLGTVLSHSKAFLKKCFKGFAGATIKPRYTFGATKDCSRGASVFERIRYTDGYNKAVTDLLSNKDLYYYKPVRDLLDYPMLDIDYEYQHGDSTIEITTVWKTALGARIIGLHDTGLMPIQNGFGDYLTNQILPKNTNITISKAQDLHRELAMENSLTREFSTSDQRNASNNILYALCRYLFPHNVFSFMELITPRKFYIKGSDTQYNTAMMCPQGNGFIFPLQTLLFYSLIWGLQRAMGVKYPIYVYGDDVILHTSIFSAFNKLLVALKLQPNLDKSFSDENIRESCGADYVYGLNVRALYVNNIPESTQDWIVLANGIRRIGYYNNGGTWRSMRYLRLWVRCIHHIEPHKRLYAPRIYGDAAINTESSKRYTISYDDKSPNVPCISGHRWERYPNKGIDHQGRPYSAEAIRVYTTREEPIRELSRTITDELIGLKADVVLRLLTDPSLVDTGYHLYKEDKKWSEDQLKSFRKKRSDGLPPAGYYPVVFGKMNTVWGPKKVPFSQYNTAPEDIDQMMDFISSASGNYITDSDHTLDIYEFKRMCRMRDLRDVLVRIVEKRDKQAIVAEKSANILLF